MITIGLVGIVGVACSSVASPSNSGDTAAPAPTLRSIPVETPIASPRSTDESDVEASVQPDPNYEEELRRARLPASTWKTDFSRHTIPFGEITPVLPRDGIPAIDSPKFVTFEEAIVWLGNQEPVISLELDGDAKAYPLQILTWHEIVNDEVAGIPVTVTFCPLCNSAIAFDRRLDGVVYDFGVSGNLRNSDLIMYDRQTQTWWQQFTGDGIVGELAGRNLTILASSIISFEDFRSHAFPEGISAIIGERIIIRLHLLIRKRVGGRKLNFDSKVRLEFRGVTITSDAGLLACRELDDALGLTLKEGRTGKNILHKLISLLRQSIYSRRRIRRHQ